MTTQTGKQSITFEKPPWIISSGCVAGTKEAEGPIWEEAESTLQKEALTIALGKAGLKAEELRYLFAGDLLGQSMATSFGLQQFDLPLFGLYGACSTAGESLALAAMTVSAESGRSGHIQSFCQCGETVSVSLGICQSKALMYYLDGYGSRCLCTW